MTPATYGDVTVAFVIICGIVSLWGYMILDEIEALRRELDALQAFRTNRGDPSGPTAPPAATANQ